MSDIVKGHKDHTQQSIFHHGIIKLIINTVLQKKGRTWEHFMFGSCIHTQQEGQPKKRQMNKQHCLVKRLKREIVEELVKDSIQEEDSVHKFEDSVYEDNREALNENQEQFSENIEESHRVDIKQEVGRSSLEQNQSFTHIQEDIMEFLVPNKLKANNLQSSNEKSKEESFTAGLKCEMVQLSAVKYQGKSLVVLRGAEARWRPKKREKNKLRR